MSDFLAIYLPLVVFFLVQFLFTYLRPVTAALPPGTYHRARIRWARRIRLPAINSRW